MDVALHGPHRERAGAIAKLGEQRGAEIDGDDLMAQFCEGDYLEPEAATEVQRDPALYGDHSGSREEVASALQSRRDVADHPRVDRAEMGIVMLLDVGHTRVHGPTSSSVPWRRERATFLPPSVSSQAGTKKAPPDRRGLEKVGRTVSSTGIPSGR